MIPYNDDLFIEEVHNLLKAAMGKIEALKKTDDDFTIENILENYRNLIINSKIVQRDQLKIIEKNIENKYGIEVRLLCHQIFIYRLYLEHIKKIEEYNFPSGVLNYLTQDFFNIINSTKKNDGRYLSFYNFQFLNCIEKLCFRAFPVGNQNISISGFPRSLFFKQKLTDLFDCMTLLFKLRGNYPLYELHHNPLRFRLFNPKGWDEAFYLTAQMMVNQPEIKGVFGMAWWYDPALKKISPELSYIRELTSNIGGHFLLFGSSESDKENAFAYSRLRKVAYEEGRYLPTSYMMIIDNVSLMRYYRLLK